MSEVAPLFTIEDRAWMAQAIRLGARGLFTTSPNPRVGCVIVRDGRVLAQGWHQRPGGPHAEAAAISAAREDLRGATVYVSLEPCSHHGRTPPCADALVEAGVARVVAAVGDPNPLVAGRGFARLRAAGIEVECGLLESEAQALNPGFFKRMQTGLPWVRCKLAMSLDGRTAMASGESRWITAEAARRDVQNLRARSCAVLTGIGTVLADDPRLDVREAPRQPLRVVADSALRIGSDRRVLAGPGQAVVATAGGDAARIAELESAGVRVLRLTTGADGRLDPRALLQALAGLQCNEVLLESGPTLAGAFARAGLIDEYVVYLAPVLLGSSARPLLELPLERIAEGLRLRITGITAVGDDWRIDALPQAAATI